MKRRRPETDVEGKGGVKVKDKQEEEHDDEGDVGGRENDGERRESGN